MPSLETAELTVTTRGILATSASANYLDEFSKNERRPAGAYQPPKPLRRRRSYDSRGKEFLVEWNDDGRPLPSWFDPLMQGLVDLLTLPPNWDTYGAGLIDRRLVDDAISYMNVLLQSSSPPPLVVPLSSGGLQLEWHRTGIDLEVVFDWGEEPFFYYRNRGTSEESEYPLPQGRELLASIIRRL